MVDNWYNNEGECLACLGETGEMDNDDRYNPGCEHCSKAALEEWVDHCENFVEADFPKSYDYEDRKCDKVYWIDLMHHENMSSMCGPETYDNVAHSWHSSMWSPVYAIDSSWSAGLGVPRELFVEYIEELKRCLTDFVPTSNGYKPPDDEEDEEDDDDDDQEVEEVE